MSDFRQQLTDHIEHTNSPIHIKEINEAELKDRSHGIEGRFGWLSPQRVFTGLRTEWHAPVCIVVIQRQVGDIDDFARQVYLVAIGYWLHAHVAQIINGNTDFVAREKWIEEELLSVSPGFMQTVSEVQMSILDKEETNGIH